MSSCKSIKAKLSVFFVLASLAMLISAYLLVHHTLHVSLAKEERDFIYDRLNTLRTIIQENPDYLDIIRKSIEWEGEHTTFPEYYLRIIDHSGGVLIETPGMTKTIPAQVVPQPSSLDIRLTDNVIRQANNGRYYLLKADAVDNSNGRPHRLVLQIALDVTSEVTADDASHKKVALLLLAEVILFVGTGVVAIQKVLSPLEKMVEVTEVITGNRISDRTDPEGLPTEVRRLAISFNTMLDRLEESLTRLSYFASNMAHEIRTPINNLMGEAEIALLRERTPEEYQRVLESGIEECTRLSRLVNNLLFLAHAEDPSMSIEQKLFSPAEEIREIYGLYAARAEEKDAILTCEGDAQLAGDPLLFRRVVSNLLMNALLYSAHGVKIDIVVRETEKEFVEVVISDSGFGIAEEEIPKIFDRFYRGDRSRSNYTEGSGLGLSIVKAIMDLHRGSVSVESERGKGSAFTLRFPNHL